MSSNNKNTNQNNYFDDRRFIKRLFENNKRLEDNLKQAREQIFSQSEPEIKKTSRLPSEARPNALYLLGEKVSFKDYLTGKKLESRIYDSFFCPKNNYLLQDANGTDVTLNRGWYHVVEVKGLRTFFAESDLKLASLKPSTLTFEQMLEGLGNLDL